jgi:hypothetical protein
MRELELEDALKKLWSDVENGDVKKNFFEHRASIRKIFNQNRTGIREDIGKHERALKELVFESKEDEANYVNDGGVGDMIDYLVGNGWKSEEINEHVEARTSQVSK